MLVKDDRKYYICYKWSSGYGLEGYDVFSKKKIHEHSDSQIPKYFQLNCFIKIAKYQYQNLLLLKKMNELC